MTTMYSDIRYAFNNLNEAYSRLQALIIDKYAVLDERNTKLIENALRQILNAYRDLQMLNIFITPQEQDLSED